jgi:phospholipid/cholesterol/gamma-HCH transport system ATP-binding protein
MVLRLVRRLNDALGLTSIVVSHDVREITAVADACYLLAGGRVAAAGAPAELAGSAREDVRQFMHGLPDGPVPFHYPAPDYERQLAELA